MNRTLSLIGNRLAWTLSVLWLLLSATLLSAQAQAAPVITSPAPGSTLPNAVVGQPMTAITINATGGALPIDGWYECDIDDPGATPPCLPPGLVLDNVSSQTSSLHGTPTTPGTYTFIVSMNDGLNQAAKAQYTLTVTSSATPTLSNVSPTSGSTAGGTSVTLTGTNLTGATAVRFGSTAASFTVNSATSITATAPANPAGVVNVSVTTPAGTTTLTNAFTYTQPMPGLTNISPNNGPTTGGTSVTLTGSNLTGATGVLFDGTPASGVTVNSATSITATTPAHAAGAVAVAVTTPGGSVTVTNFFTYNPPAPVAGPASATVAANSSANPITLNLSGGAATSVAVATPATHGTASATGASITYTPTAGYSGTDSFTYTATNAGGTSAQATITLTVSPPSLVITPPTLAGANVGAAYSQTLATSGGTAPYTWSVVVGALPAGLSLNTATGVLSGTPTVSGPFAFTVRATDQFSAVGDRGYTLNVAAPNLVINPSTLPGGSYGVPYAQPMTASNGTGPYTYSLSAGTLPGGVSLSPSGTLSGTPNAPGTFNFTLTATDSNSFSVSQPYTVIIAAPTLSLLPTTLPSAAWGSNYNATFTASGGIGPYTYTVETGALPSGMSLSSSGTLSGTPTAAGTSNFSVRATDSNGQFVVQNYGVTITPPVITITPATVPAGNVGSAYNSTFTASGGTGPYTFTISAGSLPAGVSLNPAGTLSGTPTQSGSFNFVVRTTDNFGFTGVQPYTLSVNAPSIDITPPTLGAATLGTAYSSTLSASGGIGPYSFTITAGALPAGMTLSSSGTLSGTPTAVGTFNLTVTATDNLNFTGARAYSLTVNQAAPVAGNVSLSVQANSAANPVTLALSGGPATSVAIIANASNGTALASATSITFTPNPGFAGSDSFTYTATGPGGTSNTATVSVTVTAPTLTLSPASVPGGTVGTAYAGTTYSASGGTAPYSYSVTGGALPAGLVLSSGGALSGTPTAAGSFNFVVQATDNTGFTGSQAYTLAIANQLPIAGAVSATVAANSSANAIALALSGGPVTAITITSAASHGSTSVNGSSVSYTPTAGYSGSDSFVYTATGPGGTSAPATVTLSITAPTLAITPASPTLDGATQGVAYSTQLAASGGTAPYRYALGSGSLPAGLSLNGATGTLSGTPTAVVNSNFSITVTDANGATGSQAYTLTVAAQTVTVPSSSETLAPGQTASVDLTRGASGGPFLRARLLSVSPASAGSASLSGPTTLRFAPAAAFIGSAVVTFSLENIGGNSATSTVTFAVQARPDPTQDAEVIGLLNAQSRAAERFASTQMDNFNRRLEQLHRPTCDRDSFNASVRHGREDVSLGGLGKALRDEMEGNGKGQDEDDEKRRREKDSARATSGECREQALAYWTDGFVNTGSNRARGAKDNSFITYGLSAGMDYRLSPRTVVGVGIGYGNDRADIGDHDTRSEGDALGLAAYLSVNPLSEVYIDALLGYNRIRFDSRRYVTADPSNGYAHGSRDADQLFASLTASYEYRAGALSLAPYARLNGSYTKLDAFSERGGGIYGLSYEEQKQRNLTSFLGLRGGYDIQTGLGTLTPRAGLAWGHNFTRADDYRIRYTDQGSDGLLYRLSPDPMDSNFMDLDMGLDLSLGRAWRVGVSYKTALGTNERNEMFRIGLDGKF